MPCRGRRRSGKAAAVLTRSELVDRLVGITGEVSAMAVKPTLTVADEARFDQLETEWDRLDYARIALEVGVRPDNVPLVVALLTG
jgi:hypothetical protein